MSFEYGSPKAIQKEGLGVSGKVEHFSRVSSVADENVSLVESIIVEHDSKQREALIGSLNTMLNEIGVPETYLEDIDEEQRHQVHMVVVRYLDAVVALDTEAKVRCKKELMQILG